MRLFNFFLVLLILVACSDDNDQTSIELIIPEITTLSFNEFTPAIQAVVNQEEQTIQATVPFDADLKKLTPTILGTAGSTIFPPSDYAYDFSNALKFKISLEEESKEYTVSVNNQLNAENSMLSFEVPKYYKSAEIQNNNVTIKFTYGTDLTSIQPEIAISSSATITPSASGIVDLSQAVEYTVTSENGESKKYMVSAIVEPQETAIRAFWIPAPVHSPFLRNYEGIVEGVALANELNFNVLYVCAWAQTRTLYPSNVLVQNSSYNSTDEALFNNYTGGSGDALADLVEEAHKHDIKVILWYEYGFMSRWGSAPTAENDKIIAVHPDWIGINNENEPSNYNGTDFYYNAYNEEVQEFMLDLIMEAVTGYDIDGIQGDDRLPAMPRNSGYDEDTKSKYFTAKGIQPPIDYQNWEWVRFRADILNAFAKEMYTRIKNTKPNCIVGFSPNPYPWAFDNLMQEWPVWLDANIVQILSVQCYRSTVNQYAYTIDEVLSYYTTHGNGNLAQLSPGLLLKGSNGLVDPEVLAGQIMENRERGIMGESFFYDTPLKVENIQNVIKAFYTGKAKFPELE